MAIKFLFSPIDGQFHFVIVPSGEPIPEPVTGNPIGLLLALTYTIEE